ncbi:MULTISPECIES: hypothetical protein [Bradyrhizobium]|uniref:hypothetical protein n=1 Tax=Bradyrhizobium TaxID=374 RepID=UPI001FCD3537|nr:MULTISPECIES: hypothetical protein [Bradyrhizobium]
MAPVLRKQLRAWSEVGHRRGAAAPYSLSSDPTIVKIDEQEDFMNLVEIYLRRDIRDIADNPQEYSEFVSRKAEWAATVAGAHANTYHDPNNPGSSSAVSWVTKVSAC